ncbi:MAG: hypothetical protein ACFB6R_14010 [Alphaproteobacteria bacterium]
MARMCASTFDSGVFTLGRLMPVLAFTAGLVGTAATAQERFHPLEAYCIEYRISGLQKGTVTECARKYGRESVQIQKLTPVDDNSLPSLHHRVIQRADTVVAIDLAKREAVRVFQEDGGALLTYVSGRDGTEIAEDFGRALGGEPTGERRQIAGETCDVWAANRGESKARWCMSEDGLLLSFRMPPLLKQAVAVTIGSGGPEAHYSVPGDVTVVDESDPVVIDSMLGAIQ